MPRVLSDAIVTSSPGTHLTRWRPA